MIDAEIFVEKNYWKKVVKNPKSLIIKAVKKFPKKYKFINKKVNLTVVLTDNKKIKLLNKKFRKKNKPTDILSFPTEEFKKKRKKIYLGDMIISFNYINNPKNITKIEFKQKLIKIFIHGFLHLLGFDHLKDKDFKKMLSEEEKIFELVNRKLS